MKKWIMTIFIGSIAMIVLPEKSIGQNLTSSQRARIEQQVDSLFMSTVKDAESLDYDRISKGVDDRYHAGFIVNNAYYSDYDSMISTMKMNARPGTKQSISFQQKKITALSDRIVLVTAAGVSRVELPSGQVFTVNFLWSFVYEKQKEGWRVIQSHQSKAD